MTITHAPDFPVVFNIPPAFEKAAEEVVKAAIALPTSRSSEQAELLPEHCSMRFDVGKTSDLMVTHPDGSKDYCQYLGCTLSVEIAILRDKDEPTAEDLIAWDSRLSWHAAVIREAFRSGKHPLHPGNLGYYAVSRIQPAGEVKGLSPEINADTIVLSWEIDFTILPGAWPIDA